MSKISNSTTGVGISQLFRTQDPSNFNFNWIDFLRNAGYVKFYGAKAYQQLGGDTTQVEYFLTTETIDSTTFDDSTSATGNCISGISADIDFDLTCQIPVTIASADAFAQFSYALTGDVGVNSVQIAIVHVSTAGVETSIGSQKAGQITTDNFIARALLKITTTEKSFAVGEKIRITVSWTLSEDSIKFYCDPSSLKTLTDTTLGRTIGTDFFVELPFKLQT